MAVAAQGTLFSGGGKSFQDRQQVRVSSDLVVTMLASSSPSQHQRAEDTHCCQQ